MYTVEHKRTGMYLQGIVFVRELKRRQPGKLMLS